MTDHNKSFEGDVEDVVDSVRRLVSPKPGQKDAGGLDSEKLLLTPALRVNDDKPEPPAPKKAPEAGRKALEERIAELEAAVGSQQFDWEPDGSESGDAETPKSVLYSLRSRELEDDFSGAFEHFDHPDEGTIDEDDVVPEGALEDAPKDKAYRSGSQIVEDDAETTAVDTSDEDLSVEEGTDSAEALEAPGEKGVSETAEATAEDSDATQDPEDDEASSRIEKAWYWKSNLDLDTVGAPKTARPANDQSPTEEAPEEKARAREVRRLTLLDAASKAAEDHARRTRDPADEDVPHEPAIDASEDLALSEAEDDDEVVGNAMVDAVEAEDEAVIAPEDLQEDADEDEALSEADVAVDVTEEPESAELEAGTEKDAEAGTAGDHAGDDVQKATNEAQSADVEEDASSAGGEPVAADPLILSASGGPAGIEAEAEPGSEPVAESAELPAETAASATSDLGDLEASGLIDEETLRAIVADIVRQELQGMLGERITRNVRKLVRREIHRALMAQEYHD